METQDFGIDERVGSYLRRIREAHGLELEQLSKSIRLSKSILQAIEENKWETFPTEAYLRSYISSICDKLSLDKHEVLRKFSAEVNSHFQIAQRNIVDKNEQSQDSSDNTSKIVAVVILIGLAIAFFAVKTLSGGSSRPAPVTVPLVEEQESSTETEEILDSLSQSDSVPAGQAVEKEAKNATDTLRFECSPSSTDPTCGVSLRGLDMKMNYFRNFTYRYINTKDTSHITITVPGRTRLLVNGSRLDYGNFNTILFYDGKIISKSNRELR
jgi:transcriptional regulator with XRE-family HTH domain